MRYIQGIREVVWSGVSPEDVGSLGREGDGTPERRLNIAILMSLHEDAKENAKMLKSRLSRFDAYSWDGVGRVPIGAGRICSLLMDSRRLMREAETNPRIIELCQLVGVMHSGFLDKIRDIIGDYDSISYDPFWLMAMRAKGERVRAGVYSMILNPRMIKRRKTQRHEDDEPPEG